MFTLIRSESLEIKLDPVEIIEKGYPSVSFDIKAIWKTRLHRAILELKSCWLAYHNLDKFFASLHLLKEGKIDNANLLDMSDDLIIGFNKDRNDFSIEFYCKDSFLEGNATLKVEVSEEELGECLRKIQEWEKWW